MSSKIIVHYQKGFHLIEVLVTLTLMALLASALIPLAEKSMQRSKERALKSHLQEIRLAIDAWKQAYDQGEIPSTSEQSGYPPSLEALVEGVQKTPHQPRRRFLRQIPLNPFVPSALSREQHWGIRSYVSSDHSPQAGVDVYDIYCPCTGIGLNGIPYRDW